MFCVQKLLSAHNNSFGAHGEQTFLAVHAMWSNYRTKPKSHKDCKAPKENEINKVTYNQTMNSLLVQNDLVRLKERFVAEANLKTIATPFYQCQYVLVYIFGYHIIGFRTVRSLLFVLIWTYLFYFNSLHKRLLLLN